MKMFRAISNEPAMFASLLLIAFACLITNVSANIDIFYIGNEGSNFTHSIVYKGVLDRKFLPEEFKNYCPKNPIMVLEGQKDFTLGMVAAEEGSVEVQDITMGQPPKVVLARVDLHPHMPLNTTVVGDCPSANYWGKKMIQISYTSKNNSSPFSEDHNLDMKANQTLTYVIRYNYNCEKFTHKFDISHVILAVMALFTVFFSSRKRRPTGALGDHLIPEDLSIGGKEATLWFLAFSLAMVLVAYLDLYMDMFLRIFYTLIGFIAVLLVCEDLLYLVTKDLLGCSLIGSKTLDKSRIYDENSNLYSDFNCDYCYLPKDHPLHLQ